MLERINDEVYYLRGDARVLDAKALELVEAKAMSNPRLRCRICMHASPDAAIHEMFLAHGRDVYVPPHAHGDRAESFTVITGLVTVFLFDAEGRVERIVPMGPAGSGRALSVYIPAGLCHTQIFESDVVVFHEVTSGPFKVNAVRIAPYGPRDDDARAVAAYKAELMALAAAQAAAARD
ncbi:MAG: WbuC family cupin fold metalloprotein [Proteobacteria bacterium]|nr:WbuC family cupin fold metalloprotein [Pseudomonadota bacterium]MBU1595267.1 WbuC family cupin fold metalloprotein [Pseudomonadota bacterium]